MSPPQTIIGSGLWCHFLDEQQIRSQMADAEKLGILRIDSGAHHPYSNPGLAEKMLGEIGFKDRGFVVDSKAMFSNGGDGNLTAEAVEKSIDQTLASLKTGKLNVYYALAPDRKTALEEQVLAFDMQYSLGKFAKWGICNFQPEMVEEWVEIADKKGCIKPTVFQGQYNVLCRGYEDELFPILRKNGISFNAFGALAGGMLTGKVTFSKSPEDLKGTRFEVSEANIIGSFGRKWYDKPCFHDAIRRLALASEAHGLDLVEVSLRWLAHHSQLSADNDDGIIIGPRNEQQMGQYVSGLRGEPLPRDIVGGVESIWADLKDEAEDMLVY